MTSSKSGRFGSMALLIAAALMSGRPAKGQENSASDNASSDASSGRLPAATTATTDQAATPTADDGRAMTSLASDAEALWEIEKE